MSGIRKQQNLIKKYWWVYPILILVFSAVFSYKIFTYNESVAVFDATTAPLVECLDTDRDNDFDCWAERYQILVAQNDSPAVAFADVKEADEASPYVKSNCHQIAHVIGRSAGTKYGNVADAYQNGDAYCWSGYYHGVMESISVETGKETVLGDMNAVCAEIIATAQFSFLHYNCVHGLGHGVMQIQDNNIFDALGSCKELDGTWQQESCYGGVFMENVMNEINPGHETIYLSDDDPLYPCTSVDDDFKHACYLMQTSHALRVVEQDYSKVFDLCSNVESPYDSVCFQSLGRDASGSTSSDQQETISLCELGKTELARLNCYVGAVKDFISYHNNDAEGIAMCNAIAEQQIRETCLTTAKQYYETF